MAYFYIKPDVAGGIGRGTVMDATVHPPVVNKLVYLMEGWFGDVIVTTFPCFLIVDEVRQGLLNIGFSGASFAHVDVIKSEDFLELQPDVELPSFVWLKVSGKAGEDDFGIAQNLRLVVSERVLNLLEDFGIPSAIVEPYNG
ncbi:hypothetical protein [Mesorhizobium comanense]|uniref:hypothetical protein n=1 Tax=Mesorhizobium comanense TaxID=2502215 RepID=UPI0010F78DC0|nr:hypothetical protein [Mesorhizobium comanense]